MRIQEDLSKLSISGQQQPAFLGQEPHKMLDMMEVEPDMGTGQTTMTVNSLSNIVHAIHGDRVPWNLQDILQDNKDNSSPEEWANVCSLLQSHQSGTMLEYVVSKYHNEEHVESLKSTNGTLLDRITELETQNTTLKKVVGILTRKKH